MPMPSAAEERCRSLAARGLPCVSGWRSYGPVVSALFFVLTLIAVVTFYALGRGFLTAIVAIATAEWLIVKKRFFGTGIEAALWIGGLSAALISLAIITRGSETLLLFGGAFAVAGARVRSALAGLAATLFVLVYVAMRVENGWVMMLLCAGLAILAALAMTRVWLRPSTERLFAAHVLAMPLAAGLFGQMSHPAGRTPAGSVFLLLAALLLGIGVRWRDRIVLVAAAVAVGCAGVLLHEMIAWPGEAKLIAAGALLVALAAALTHALRDRTEGFVLTRSEATGFDEAIQIAGAVAAARPRADDAPVSRGEGGGGFGGAGSTGEF